MNVTIMSDASFCHNTMSAGYGLWIKSDRGHFQGNGNYKKVTKSICLLEGKALFNAVFIAFKTGLAKEGDNLILQTDSLMFVNCLNKGHMESTDERKLAESLKDYIKNKKCTFKLKHVRAHSPKTSAKNYINEICDGLARQAMVKQRGW